MVCKINWCQFIFPRWKNELTPKVFLDSPPFPVPLMPFRDVPLGFLSPLASDLEVPDIHRNTYVML